MSDEFIKEMTADHIRNMRLKTGLTQEDFCVSFGINLNTFRHWERGDRKPTGSSLIFLNMIESAGAEVLSILNSKKKSEVNMSKAKDLLINNFINRKYLTLESYVSSDSFDISTILPLLKANGLPFVESYNQNEFIIFTAGYESNSLKEVLRFDIKNKLYSGDFKNIIDKTYLVAYAIEQDLRDAVFWTPKMRDERVNSILKEINVDNEFYNNVLRNW